MKKFLNNFKSYGFWVSLSGALIILANAIGRAFGFSIENQLIEDLIMSIAGVLLVLGIVTKVDDENKEDDEKNCEDEQDESGDLDDKNNMNK